MRTPLVAGLRALGGCGSVYDLAGGAHDGPQVFGGVRTWPELPGEALHDPRRGACPPAPRHACRRDLPEVTL